MLAETQPNGIRLYYEPHCDYDEAAVAKIGKVDAIVTPANSQVLIKFPLVSLSQCLIGFLTAVSSPSCQATYKC